jgi:hypothetical protein
MSDDLLTVLPLVLLLLLQLYDLFGKYGGIRQIRL